MKILPNSQINNLPLPVEFIERRIYLIQGQKIMLDSDLAELYQVPTFRLNEAVKRNRNRFPEDFMFRLTKEDHNILISHFAMSKGSGGRRNMPYAFTEHGVAMLSAVLKSERAVKMSILIVRAFIQLRQILASHKDVERKIAELERRQMRDGGKIDVIYKIVQRLISTPDTPKNKIGFREK